MPGFTPGPLPQLTSLALPARSRSTTRCSKVHRTFSRRSCPLGFKSRFIRINEKEERQMPFFFFMVGVPGFEPGASWSRTKHATNLRYTPIFFRDALTHAARRQNADALE